MTCAAGSTINIRAAGQMPCVAPAPPENLRQWQSLVDRLFPHPSFMPMRRLGPWGGTQGKEADGMLPTRKGLWTV